MRPRACSRLSTVRTGCSRGESPRAPWALTTTTASRRGMAAHPFEARNRHAESGGLAYVASEDGNREPLTLAT
jgi:hypothetical protein